MIDRIGATVQAARKRGGGSLEDLAARSGVPSSVLAALERGEVGITTTELQDVAAALSLDLAALLNGREIQRSTPSIFLRHQQLQDFDHRDEGALDDALDQGRLLADLRRELGEPPLALQAGRFRPCEPATHRPDAPALDGYRRARDLRRWLNNVAEPLGDLRALIEERFGVAIVVRQLESQSVTAVCVRADAAAALVLNARDSQRAQNPLLGRVVLAHELCHALFDPSSGGIHVVLDVLLDRKVHAAEQRARAFAAELLLPRQGLKQMIDEPGEIRDSGAALDLIERVRGRFGTPHPITANHLCNLGFISAELREWLEAGVTTFAGTPPETTLPDVDGPSVLVTRLAERAHRDGLVTDGEARTILGLDRIAPLPWEAEL